MELATTRGMIFQGRGHTDAMGKAKSLAEFAARRRQMKGSIFRRDMRVPKNTSRETRAFSKSGAATFRQSNQGVLTSVVKGTSRRVIVVDSPDTELFEQAIFIVRNDILSERGVTAQMLVDEACRVAKSCSRASPARGRGLLRRLSPLLYGALGALGIGLVWLLTALV